MKIVCDWDLVVAPLDVAWLEWLVKVSGDCVGFSEAVKNVDYDLTKYFPGFREKFNIDPYGFLDNPHLYDTMGCIKPMANFLEGVVKEGDNALIASVTKGGHLSSKHKHVLRTLPTIDFGKGSGNGFFATKEKYLLPCDIAIDDRAENLLYFPDHVVKIYYNTMYKDLYLEELKKKPNVVVTGLYNQAETCWQIYSMLKERGEINV